LRSSIFFLLAKKAHATLVLSREVAKMEKQLWKAFFIYKIPPCLEREREKENHCQQGMIQSRSGWFYERYESSVFQKCLKYNNGTNDGELSGLRRKKEVCFLLHTTKKEKKSQKKITRIFFV